MNYLKIDGKSVSVFDICQAHAQLESDYNRDGIVRERPSNARRNESTGCQLSRMKYSDPRRWVDIVPVEQWVVDGLEFDDPDSSYLGDGEFAPFVVFDTRRQENFESDFPTRAAAQEVADSLNRELDDAGDDDVRDIYLQNVLKWGLPIDAQMMRTIKARYVPWFLAKYPQCAGIEYHPT